MIFKKDWYILIDNEYVKYYYFFVYITTEV